MMDRTKLTRVDFFCIQRRQAAAARVEMLTSAVQYNKVYKYHKIKTPKYKLFMDI